MSWDMWKDPERDDMPCEDCGSVEQCAPHRDRELCYGCWHAAREKEPPWMIVFETDESFRANPVAYLEEEARAFAAKTFNSKAVPAASWAGERLAHPGYMARRRGALLAEHPEYR